MAQPDRDYLLTLLFRRLSRCPDSIVQAVANARELVMFGSTAAGLCRSDSDVDLLCVDHHDSTLRCQLIDLVCVSEAQARSDAWMTSELSCHIAQYGVWLKGAAWSSTPIVGRAAIARKDRRLRAFLRHLPDAWSRLSECFKIKYSIKLRRETQRLLLLMDGQAVPPTLVLDEFWRHTPAARALVFQTLDSRFPVHGQPLAQDLVALMGSSAAMTGSSNGDLLDRREFQPVYVALQASSRVCLRYFSSAAG